VRLKREPRGQVGWLVWHVGKELNCCCKVKKEEKRVPAQERV